MHDRLADPSDTVRLLRARQIREFTDEAVDPTVLDAIADCARWSGSSQNSQPWRFIVIRSRATLQAVAQSGLPSTKSLLTAAAAIAIVLPQEPGRGVSHAYDEGRAAERVLIAASILGLGGAIAWIGPKGRPAVGELLGLPEDRFVRTVMAIGHPAESARRPRSTRGEARLPRQEMVMQERWQG